MKVEIYDTGFEPWQEITSYQKQRPGRSGKFGATTVFIGSMRDMNAGAKISSMRLEHYPAMAKKHLQEIALQALNKWEILDVLILHRVGRVYPGDALVCVAVWSAHRAAAYAANRFIMENLKSEAPFWKQEQLQKTERWIEKNT